MDDTDEYTNDAIHNIMSLGLSCHNHIMEYLNDGILMDNSLNLKDVSKIITKQKEEIDDLKKQLREKDEEVENKMKEREKQEEFNREKLKMDFERKQRAIEKELMEELRDKDVEIGELKERIIQNQQMTMKLMMRTHSSSSVHSFSSKEKKRHSKHHRSKEDESREK
jgi:hypothetical protein